MLGCTSFSTQGTSGDDNFFDTVDRSTSIDMLGGDDLAEMASCNDAVFGSGGFDELHGAFGTDFVSGLLDNDRPSSCDPFGNCGGLFGGAGNDTIEGGAGLDDLDDSQAGSDTDDLDGGSNNDVLNASDGDGSDALNGGSGTDNCTSDVGDTETSC